jgi:hypothetical protein
VVAADVAAHAASPTGIAAVSYRQTAAVDGWGRNGPVDGQPLG